MFEAAFYACHSPMQCFLSSPLLCSLITKVECHFCCSFFLFSLFFRKFLFPISCLVTMHCTPTKSIFWSLHFVSIHIRIHVFFSHSLCLQIYTSFSLLLAFCLFLLTQNKKLHAKNMFSLQRTNRKMAEQKPSGRKEFDIISHWKFRGWTNGIPSTVMAGIIACF